MSNLECSKKRADVQISDRFCPSRASSVTGRDRPVTTQGRMLVFDKSLTYLPLAGAYFKTAEGGTTTTTPNEIKNGQQARRLPPQISTDAAAPFHDCSAESEPSVPVPANPTVGAEGEGGLRAQAQPGAGGDEGGDTSQTHAQPYAVRLGARRRRDRRVCPTQVPDGGTRRRVPGRP